MPGDTNLHYIIFLTQRRITRLRCAQGRGNTVFEVKATAGYPAEERSRSSCLFVCRSVHTNVAFRLKDYRQYWIQWQKNNAAFKTFRASQAVVRRIDAGDSSSSSRQRRCEVKWKLSLRLSTTILTVLWLSITSSPGHLHRRYLQDSPVSKNICLVRQLSGLKWRLSARVQGRPLCFIFHSPSEMSEVKEGGPHETTAPPSSLIT